MRVKDDIKQDALFESTVKLVNDIGFAASSVSKIAKDAGVSPATLYVYHENKEALLVATYVRIKQLMGAAISRDFDDSRPIRDILKQVWLNIFDFVKENPAYFQYMEQFSNSPFCDLVNKAEVEAYFLPVIQVITRGMEQKIIKDVDFDVIGAFMFFPAVALANPRHSQNFEMTRDNIETAFGLAWDAIRR
ncbi:MAG: TetR/AcrR family transcriptional regulator [Desulfobacterales bacterium]|nr:TetR/AcrR family transcriptional regulator [Desulfobacterales bacterium]